MKNLHTRSETRGGRVTALLIKDLLKSSIKLWLVVYSIMIIGGKIMMPVQAVVQVEKYISNALQGGFIENLGQWPDEVLFMANTKSLRALITTKSMVFEQFESPINDNHTINAHTASFDFVGTSKMNIATTNERATKYNFIIGQDISKYAQNAKIYEEVKLLNVFDKIDIKFYFEEYELRYDFIVQPYADPNKIKFIILGSEGYEINNKYLFMQLKLTKFYLNPLNYLSNNLK